MHLPFDWSWAGVPGAADTVDIPVGGIKVGDVLLAVISHSPGTDPVAVDVTDFTVAAGKITAATETTADKNLTVIWAEARA